MAGARHRRTRADGGLRHRARLFRHHRLLRCRHPHDRAAVAVAAGSDQRVLHLRRVPRHRRRGAPQRSSASDRDHRGDGAENAPGFRDDEPARRALRRHFHGLFRRDQFHPRLRQFPHAVADADRALVCGDPDQRRLHRAVHARAIGQRLAPRLRAATAARAVLNNALILGLMTALFLVLGYSGVPVAFALMAGVFVGTLFTPISLPSIVGQLFNGIDTEALMAIPFFLLVGELMTSANIVIRIVNLSQALVGHLRGGLAQVVTVFSMFFSGMSGSSSADVAVLSRTMAKPMAQEGYSPAFVAALIAAASTIANMVPPSIMAVVYGAIGNVSIAGLFLGGIVPGVMVGLGLMIYCYFFGPAGFRRPRSSVWNFAEATKAAALPLMIPIILLGGIMTGWFAPREAGVVAIVYILLVVIPLLNFGHLRRVPRDFAQAGLIYSLPLITIGAASAFGWLLACLRGPIGVPGWIANLAGDDPYKIMFALVALFTIVGDFIEPIPCIVIFMPIVAALTEIGGINPVHMGVVLIVTLAFGLITPPYGLALFDGLEIRRRTLLAGATGFTFDLRRLFRDDRGLYFSPRCRAGVA